MKPVIALTLATIGFSSTVVAQATRDLDSHEHGSAELNVALDSGVVYVELESPWDNLVGFEHAPENDEQQALVDDALELLTSPENLFTFNGASCNVADMVLESGLGSNEDGDHGHEHDDDHDDEHKDDHSEHDDDHHDEHKDDHSAEHDDDHHDEHKDDHSAEHDDDHHDDHKDDHSAEHDDHASEESSHASLLLVASFSCDNMEELTSIDVALLGIWSGFEDLDVQLIGPGGQAALELGQNQSIIDVKPVQ